ncbi:hypothetical protein SAMN05421813_1218 [Daejeonella rubra]|uniref:Uncharacterized protein n=1 Tax=Daejeonella rubra TaxID=990371 RepID=A0A1G9VIQ7_9SPHI|nr:hypothetical protein SAMN05421813_1218 [Daejeonella rubra]
MLIVFIHLLSQKTQSRDLNYMYKSMVNGYKSFRIPAIVSTNKGTLKNHCSLINY